MPAVPSSLVEPLWYQFQALVPEVVDTHPKGGHRPRIPDRIASKGIPAPIQASTRWVVEKTNSWHNRGFKKLAICTEVRIRVIDAFIALANAIITVRRLIREGWTRYRWNGRPTRRP